MFDKISTRKIILDHLATLRDNKTNLPSVWDMILFFVMPIGVGILFLSVFKLGIGKDAAGILTTSLSVFAALLFNLLLLVYDIVTKEGENISKKRALNEIFANISFSILLSVSAVIYLLISYLLDGLTSKFPIVDYALDFIVYYLVTSFLLTLFMVLKRAHILLSHEIK